MKKPLLLGIDLGSSSVKATLFSADCRPVKEARRDNHPCQPRPGVAEYDAHRLFKATCAAIRQVMDEARVRPGDVAAVCADGMISGTMGIDAEGEATTPYTTTLDMRFAPQLNQVMDRWHDLIRLKTGSGQPTIGPKMMWTRDAFPGAYRRTAKFVTITGYVAGQLAGLNAESAFIDHTHLWASGLSDTEHFAWSPELCEAMGLPVGKLPRIVAATDIVGRLCRKAATATGLKEGTPVVAGAGDQSAAFVGAGLTRPGRMGDAAGTYPILSVCTDEFSPDLTHRMAEIMPSPVPGLWNPCSIIIGGGLTHHWFGKMFGGANESKAGGTSGLPAVFARLDKEAGRLSPGSDKLFFNPHLGGQACPTRTYLKGAWMGFTWTHQPAHFYRALLEAIAYDQSLAWQAMRSAYPQIKPREVVVYGGGARSHLWNQIKADVMGLPYVCCEREDLAALGAVIIAGCALGLYDNMAVAAERSARHTRRFKPRARVHQFYRVYADLYRRLLEQTDACYQELWALPEWADAKRDGR